MRTFDESRDGHECVLHDTAALLTGTAVHDLKQSLHNGTADHRGILGSHLSQDTLQMEELTKRFDEEI